MRPDVVLLPFLTDRHADHFATSRCFMAAVDAIAAPWTETIECLGYEVWSPIYANLSIDISACFETKRRAIACHASQLAHDDLLAGIEGLNRFRAVSGLVGGSHAEAYFRAPLPLFSSLYQRMLS
jgi:LmbE family N-acetylglucosaminyl deacetylase